jgi:hypothetical protein
MLIGLFQVGPTEGNPHSRRLLPQTPPMPRRLLSAVVAPLRGCPSPRRAVPALNTATTAGSSLSRSRPPHWRSTRRCRRDHPRRRHDFVHREVERVCPEAALHPTFSVEEATGHDPAVLEPDVVQRLRHCLGDVVVPAGPNFRRHTKVIKVSLPNLKPPLEHAAPAL